MNCINLLPTLEEYTLRNVYLIAVWPEQMLLIMLNVSRNQGHAHILQKLLPIQCNYWTTKQRDKNRTWGNEKKPDLVTTMRSFLMLSAPGFSFWTSPFFCTGFFCFLWRAALMASAQCLGCSWGVTKWKHVYAEMKRRTERTRKISANKTFLLSRMHSVKK